MQFYTMKRKGTFNVAIATSNQCKKFAHEQYEYQVEVIFDSHTKLNSNDFIIDHIAIDETIQALSLLGSCEIMHIYILNALRRLFSNNKLSILAMRTDIIPIFPKAQAQLTFTWALNTEHLKFLK